MVGQLTSTGSQHDAVRSGVVLAVPCVLPVKQVKRVLKRFDMPGQRVVLFERGLHLTQRTYNVPEIGRA